MSDSKHIQVSKISYPKLIMPLNIMMNKISFILKKFCQSVKFILSIM